MAAEWVAAGFGGGDVRGGGDGVGAFGGPEDAVVVVGGAVGACGGGGGAHGAARSAIAHQVHRAVWRLRSILDTQDDAHVANSLSTHPASSALCNTIPLYRCDTEDTLASASSAWDAACCEAQAHLGVLRYHADAVAAAHVSHPLVAAGVAERLHSACALMVQALTAEQESVASFQVMLPVPDQDTAVECVCGAVRATPNVVGGGPSGSSSGSASNDAPLKTVIGSVPDTEPTVCVCGGRSLPLYIRAAPAAISVPLRILSVILGLPPILATISHQLTNWTHGAPSLSEADAVSLGRLPERLSWRLLGVEDEERILLAPVRCAAASRPLLACAAHALSAIQSTSMTPAAKEEILTAELSKLEMVLKGLEQYYEFPTNPRGEAVLMRRLHRILFTDLSSSDMFAFLYGVALPDLVVVDHLLGIVVEGPLAEMRAKMFETLPFPLRQFLRDLCKIQPDVRSYIVGVSKRRRPSEGPGGPAEPPADSRRVVALKVAYMRALDAVLSLRRSRSDANRFRCEGKGEMWILFEHRILLLCAHVDE